MTLDDATRTRLVEALQGFFLDTLDDDLSTLHAGLLLDFVLAHAGPVVYEQAVRDVQTHLRTVVGDLDVAVLPPAAR